MNSFFAKILLYAIHVFAWCLFGKVFFGFVQFHPGVPEVLRALMVIVKWIADNGLTIIAGIAILGVWAWQGGWKGKE